MFSGFGLRSELGALPSDSTANMLFYQEQQAKAHWFMKLTEYRPPVEHFRKLNQLDKVIKL